MRSKRMIHRWQSIMRQSSARRARTVRAFSGRAPAMERLEPRVLLSAVIGDLVFNDANANGLQDPGETGIAGVVVRLFDPGDAVVGNPDDVQFAQAITDANGLYNFEVPADHYYLQFEAPTGYVITLRNVGGDDAVDSDPSDTTGRTDRFQVLDNTVDNTRDAGMYQEASIGNFIWNDANANGIQDFGEQGIAGVQVNLLDSQDIVIGTLLTNSEGRYRFNHIPPGSGYTVQVQAPAGGVFSPAFAGGNDELDSNANASGQITNITLAQGEVDLSLDVGIVLADGAGGASVGNLVFQDLNANGIKQTGENGVEGVTVELFTPGVDSIAGNADDVLVASTVSGSTGQYLFSGLDAGDYYLHFVAPADTRFSPANQGTEDTLDSDVDPDTGNTEVFTLAQDQADPSWDAGLVAADALPDLTLEFDGLLLPGNGQHDVTTLVPGDRLIAALTAANEGTLLAFGRTDIDLYLSTDGTLDGGDTLLTSRADLPLRLAPGRTRPLRIPAVVPAGLEPGTYFLIAAIDTGDQIVEDDENNNTAVLADALEVKAVFGQVDSRRVRLRSVDADGTGVVLSLVGGGSAELIDDGAGNLDLIVTGATSRSVLLIQTDRNGDGRFSIDNLLTNSSLNAIIAPTTDIEQSVIIAGNLHQGRLGNFALGSVLEIQGPVDANGPVRSGVILNLGSLTDASIDLAVPIQLLRMVRFAGVDTAAGTGNITAPSINALRVSGDVRNVVAGDLSGGVDISDEDSVLVSAVVAGVIRDASIRTAGDIGTVVTGGLFDSIIFAGVDPSVNELPDAISDFTRQSTLRSVVVRGLAGDTDPDTVNSSIAAYNIGTANLRLVQTDNGGVPFGLAANHITSVGYISSTDSLPHRLTNLLAPNEIADGDFILRLLEDVV